MGYLETFGPRADPVTALGWGLLGLSCAVVIIVTLLVLFGVLARRQRGARPGEMDVQRGAGGLRWIYVGLSLTVVTLVASLIWTIGVVAAVGTPRSRPAVTLQVTGHQWWWEVAYQPDKPARAFVTANEIHIPVGVPVEVRLTGADVIHSFWVPALTGKTDTIPGRTNVSWLQADRPGLYRGQCAEYCGMQHAHMALYVVAEPQAQFDAWLVAQRAASSTPVAVEPVAGAQIFLSRCGACHTVRGTDAGGVVGPDLTHLMSRRTIAAGTLPNNPLTLSGWVANPQALKPGARMPPTYLSGPQLAALRAYLETLR
jgi:cytochrome c oxidase subunit 2